MDRKLKDFQNGFDRDVKTLKRSFALLERYTAYKGVTRILWKEHAARMEKQKHKSAARKAQGAARVGLAPGQRHFGLQGSWVVQQNQLHRQD